MPTVREPLRLTASRPDDVIRHLNMGLVENSGLPRSRTSQRYSIPPSGNDLAA